MLGRARLIPLDDGSVRQVIEFSRADGDTWQPLFDAIYVPSGSGKAEVP